MTRKNFAEALHYSCSIMRLVLPALSLSASSAYATTYYFSKNGAEFTNGSNWKDEFGNPSKGPDGEIGLNPEHDYVVRGFATNLTIEGITCNINSLTIGDNGVGGRLYLNRKKSSETNTEITFANKGLFLAKGSMRSESAQCNIRGNITVTATEDAPFGVFPRYSNREILFNPPKDGVSGGALLGDEGSAIVIGLEYAINNDAYVAQDAYGYLASFCNFGNYEGLISVTSKYDNASCTNGYGSAVSLNDPAGNLPGSLRICGGGGLLLSTNAAEFTVGKLALEPGSMIQTVVDLKNKKCVRLKPSELVVNGPVCVMATYEHTVFHEEIRLVLMTAPEGTALNADDFYFHPDPNVTDESHADKYQQRAHLEVVPDENGIDTLYLVIEPIVKLIATDSSSVDAFDTDPVLEKPEAWQDGSVPVGGRHYHLNSKYLQLLGNSDYTFPGKSFIHDGGRTMFSGARNIVFSNYVWRSGIIYAMKDADVVLKGKMLVSAVSAATSPRTLRSFKYPIEVNSDISGSGDIDINNAGNDPYQAKVTLSGDNTKYSGKIAVSNYYSNISYPKRWTYLYVSKAESLGGPIDGFTFDALSLSRMARLIPTASMTLPETSNRGLFVNGDGVIAPNENVALRMEWPTTMNGTLHKAGAGVLEMAGEIKFYDTETATSSDTPRTEADVLDLYEGALKIASSKACNGLRIDVSAGTSILLPKPGTDGNLDKYGLYNVKAGAVPFVLKDGVSKLPIAFEGQLSADSLEDTVTNALFTVANSALESVRGMLPYGVKPYGGVRASIVEMPVDGEDATTFACVSKRQGLVFSVR